MLTIKNQLKKLLIQLDLKDNDIIIITGSLISCWRSFKFKLNIFFYPRNDI